MEVYTSSTSIASALIPSSHNSHSNYVHKYSKKIEKQLGPWKFGKLLGQGSTSKVILGTHEVSGKQAAIKIVNKSHLDPSEISSNEIDSAGLPYGIQREIIIMKLLNNENTMKLYDVYESKNHLYLITEYVSGGELFEYLVKCNGPMSEYEAVKLFDELMSGVLFLHNWGIVHRDLKLENILIDKNNHLKIADFGMATLELLKYSTDEDKKTTKIPAFLLSTSCGSPHYAAPEVINASNYNGLKSDIWSCGVILYSVLCGTLPFDLENIKDLLILVQKGQYVLPDFLSPEAKDLISSMLDLDPDTRFDAEQVLKHKLFQKYGMGYYNKSRVENYRNINVFTNSINQELIKTNDKQEVIINNFNFTKKLASSKNIDKRIFNHLMILYHNKKSQTDIVENLTNNKVNIDKVFYSLLIDFDIKAKKFVIKDNIINYEEEIEIEEDSYPAEMKDLKMSKTYSNISIVAGNKRRVLYNNKIITHNKNGSLGRLNYHIKSNKNISGYSTPHYAGKNYMKISNSIASYEGSLNLSQYLRDDHVDDHRYMKDRQYMANDDEFEDDEYDNQFDEAVNVISPGVPISRVDKLASSYSKLNLNTYNLNSYSRDNFDFELTNDEMEKQKLLEKEITKKLVVNYKVLPKRNKRFKTSSYLVDGENTYQIENSPKKKKKGKKIKSSASKKSIKPTLSSKVLSNYIRAYDKYNTKNNYIDALTTTTKSEFEGLCDQFFGRSDANYQNIFGESYIERRAKEEEAKEIAKKQAKIKAAKKAARESAKKRQAAAKAIASAISPTLTIDEIKLLANKQSLNKNMFINRAPISKLDPGLGVNGSPFSNTSESKESLIFTQSNDIFEPTNTSGYDSKSSLRNFSSTIDSGSNKVMKPLIQELHEETIDDIEHDFEMVTPNGLSDSDTPPPPVILNESHGLSPEDSLLKNAEIGDSTKDLIKRTINCDNNYQGYYNEDPEITNTSESPFHTENLTDKVLNEESKIKFITNDNDSSCNLITNGVTNKRKNPSLFRRISSHKKEKPVTIIKENPSNYLMNRNNNKELIIELSRNESLIAIKSLLVNWKKYGIKDVKLKDNVISGGIKNTSKKSFLRKITNTCHFKIFVYEHQSKSKLEFQKVKGSTVIFDNFLLEIESVLSKEGVLN